MPLHVHITYVAVDASEAGFTYAMSSVVPVEETGAAILTRRVSIVKAIRAWRGCSGRNTTAKTRLS